MDRVLVTKEGHKKLIDELKNLKEVKRLDASKKIKDARDMGDVLENLAYDSFLEEQGLIELRITEIENTLSRCQVIDKKKTKASVVEVGSVVKVELNKNVYSFEIVSSIEANPIQNKISNESPVGKHLMGKKSGDVVEINTPVFTVKYKIISID